MAQMSLTFNDAFCPISFPLFHGPRRTTLTVEPIP